MTIFTSISEFIYQLSLKKTFNFLIRFKINNPEIKHEVKINDLTFKYYKQLFFIIT